jgi:hypothetical protein
LRSKECSGGGASAARFYNVRLPLDRTVHLNVLVSAKV